MNQPLLSENIRGRLDTALQRGRILKPGYAASSADLSHIVCILELQRALFGLLECLRKFEHRAMLGQLTLTGYDLDILDHYYWFQNGVDRGTRGFGGTGAKGWWSAERVATQNSRAHADSSRRLRSEATATFDRLCGVALSKTLSLTQGKLVTRDDLLTIVRALDLVNYAISLIECIERMERRVMRGDITISRDDIEILENYYGFRDKANAILNRRSGGYGSPSLPTNILFDDNDLMGLNA